MSSLNCDICIKTDNHCCKADIPLDIPIALALVEISGLTNLAITETPKFPGSVVIVDKNWLTDPGVQVDIQTKDCVFLKEGKCIAYDHRPDICRWYGTKQIRCRWEFIEPSKIAKATKEDVNYYDKVAMENSSIYVKEWNKMEVDDYIDLFNIDSKCYSKTYDIIAYMLNDFKEERKAIFRNLESRRCENCIYNKKQDDFMIFCDKEMCPDGSKMMWHSFTKDFCCKYWESK